MFSVSVIKKHRYIFQACRYNTKEEVNKVLSTFLQILKERMPLHDFPVEQMHVSLPP